MKKYVHFNVLKKVDRLIFVFLFLLSFIFPSCEKETVGFVSASIYYCGCYGAWSGKIKDKKFFSCDTLKPTDSIAFYYERTKKDPGYPYHRVESYLFPYLLDLKISLIGDALQDTLQLSEQHLYFRKDTVVPGDSPYSYQIYVGKVYSTNEFLSKYKENIIFTFYIGLSLDLIDSLPKPAMYSLLITLKDSFKDNKIITSSCISKPLYLLPE